jgi:hypothetical protein
MILFAPSAAHIIPRDVIIEGDLDEFLEELASHIPTTIVDNSDEAAIARPGNGTIWKRFAKPIGIGLIWSCPLSGPVWLGLGRVLPSAMPGILYGLIYALVLCVLPITMAVIAAQPDTHIDEECRCRRCRYLLRGLREPRCPECGESI